MANACYRVTEPTNEPVQGYMPGSRELQELQEQLHRQSAEEIEIPLIIGGEEVQTGKLGTSVMPHDHEHVLARFHQARRKHVMQAVKASMEARDAWLSMRWEARAAVFKKAADLLSMKYRATLNAATMLGQSKVVLQAEIDSAAELVDFLRFNTYHMARIASEQPPHSPAGQWNATEARPLDGFVFAVTPFNFTSIAGNLPTAPAIMGNTVLWKPASTAVFSAYHFMKILQEAGLPPGVINFIPGPGSEVGPAALTDPRMAGVHFTGSTATFQSMWRTIGENIAGYRSYPRIVGETGGKDFIMVHPSADLDQTATAAVRGAFEYQGQKCSAASRMYVPDTLWPALKDRMVAMVESIRMGDVAAPTTFMGAVIDRRALEKIGGYIDRARKSQDAQILVGGGRDDSKGWFVEPTIVVASDPGYETMKEEIFGPVLTVYVYPEARWAETLTLCDRTSPYGLTGAVFARDREAINEALEALRFSAGNFYINDKPTGAVVGQQPFGGSRASGTNDKAGSLMNMLRWTSVRTIKENFVPPTDYRYPHMSED